MVLIFFFFYVTNTSAFVKKENEITLILYIQFISSRPHIILYNIKIIFNIK